jgi:Tol biopolymer transport system component
MARLRYCRLRATLALAALAVPSLAACGGSDDSGAGSAESGMIAFKRYFDPAADTWSAVFTASPDGSDETQLTHPQEGTSDDQPAWSTDGEVIVFTRCPSGALCHTYVMKPDGSALRPIGPVCPAGATETSCADESNVTPSPDGKRVAFTSSTGVVRTDPAGEGWIERSALTLMNLDGTGRRMVRQLTDNQGDLTGAAFSPNGRQLVFEHLNSSFASRTGRAVFVINVDGSGLRQLTPWIENSGDNPDWSPDGKWILFHSHVDDPSAQSQYFVIRPDGTGRRQVTHFPADTHLASASFSPDSKSLVISKGPEGGNIDVWTIKLDGTGLTRVTKSERWESAPDWGTG